MQVTTFLMFAGKAEEAMTLYASVFAGSSVAAIERWAPGEAGASGTVKRGVLDLLGTRYIFFDSPGEHAFTFTPAVSLFVDCDSREELNRAFELLGAGGRVLMPPAAYGFSAFYAWVEDRYGVSWQLNLP
jgi:predicted 3-demethylubiquinone-9 3-methyltransferase (glyoxalase superfamily)